MTRLAILRRRPGRRGAAFLAGLAFASWAAAGCGGGTQRPVRLLDGSVAARLPHALRGLGQDAVLSALRVLPASRLDPRDRACLEAFRGEFRISPATVVVSRVGTSGASLTFRDETAGVVLGCDRTAARAGATPSRPWCARSVGYLAGGRLRDPRVDVLCRDAHGDPVGFGWVEPRDLEAHWIVVRGGPQVEVEPAAAGLPVRVLTRDVDRETSSATFAVTEYGRSGKELVRYRVRAAVAG